MKKMNRNGLITQRRHIFIFITEHPFISPYTVVNVLYAIAPHKSINQYCMHDSLCKSFRNLYPFTLCFLKTSNMQFLLSYVRLSNELECKNMFCKLAFLNALCKPSYVVLPEIVTARHSQAHD